MTACGYPSSAINAASGLGSLGGTISQALAINTAGQTGGVWALTGSVGGFHAFFSDVTGPMIDLSTLLAAGSGLLLQGDTGGTLDASRNASQHKAESAGSKQQRSIEDARNKPAFPAIAINSRSVPDEIVGDKGFEPLTSSV